MNNVVSFPAFFFFLNTILCGTTGNQIKHLVAKINFVRVCWNRLGLIVCFAADGAATAAAPSACWVNVSEKLSRESG